MTSNPASRSAAATTFAPRSWPSRPGFATMTRYFLVVAVTGSPIDRRFAPFAEDLAEGVDDLPERDPRLRRFEDPPHEIVVSLRGRPDRLEGALDRAAVPLRLEFLHRRHLVPLDPRIDLEDRQRLFAVLDVLVDPDVDVPPLLDVLLELIGGLRNLKLRVALFNRGNHPAAPLDLRENLFALLLHLRRHRLDEVRARERIDEIGQPCFVREDLLRPERDLDRRLGRKRERLVHRVRMERLRSAKDRGKRLDGGADDVVLRLLRRERAARRLRVESEPPALGVLRAVPLLHPLRPDPPRRSELRDLLEEVHMGVEEEGEPRRELVDGDAGLDPELDVREAVHERI